MPFKMHKIILFPEKNIKRICVPTLPKMFRPVTRNTLFFAELQGAGIAD